MSIRASRLQRAHVELDVTRESLAELEEIIIGDVYLCDDDAILTLGAYLGEAIIASGEGIEWIDFAHAAARSPRITAGGSPAENHAFLIAGDELRAPLSEIVALMNHRTDRHLREFADDVIERARPPAVVARSHSPRSTRSLARAVDHRRRAPARRGDSNRAPASLAR